MILARLAWRWRRRRHLRAAVRATLRAGYNVSGEAYARMERQAAAHADGDGA